MIQEVPPPPLDVQAEAILTGIFEVLLTKEPTEEQVMDGLRKAYRCGAVQREHAIKKEFDFDKMKALATKLIVALVDIQMSRDHEHAMELASKALASEPMKIDEINEQRASFAFGQLAMTSKYREASSAELSALRSMCRRLAGCKEG